MADPKSAKNIHVIGIGGAGCSAVGGWLQKKGHNVSGCDIKPNQRTEGLKEEGIKIFDSHNQDHLEGVDWVIYSPSADHEDNEELIQARKQGIKTSTHIEALAEITKDYKTIAVAGAHGKTTTTMMISKILGDSGLDPNYFVGEGIYRVGKGDYFVLEADEYRKGFLNYLPDIAVITNIAYDHPDCYKNEREVVEAFKAFAKNVREGGTVIGCSDDPNVREVLECVRGLDLNVVPYQRSMVTDYSQDGFSTKANLNFHDQKSVELKLAIPGEHNILNAIGSILAAKLCGIDYEDSIKSLKEYRPVRRRFEKFAELEGKPLISDWAHHPDQIQSVMKSLRSAYPEGDITVVFEPHQFERTLRLFDRFVTCWEGVDKLFVLPIYKVEGRESKKALESVSSERLVKEIMSKTGVNVTFLDGYAAMAKAIAAYINQTDVVAFLSGGPLDDYVKEHYKK